MPRKQKIRRDGVYTRNDRKGFWTSYVDGTGVRRQKRLGALTFQQAKDELAVLRSQAIMQRNTNEAPLTEQTFAKFAKEFLKSQKRRIAAQVGDHTISLAEYLRQQGIVDGYLTDHFGAMKLRLIRSDHVNEYIINREGAKASPGTIIKEVNTLKRLFNYAIELGKIKTNPTQKAKVPKAPPGRTRWLTQEESLKVLDACTLYDYRHDENREARQHNLRLKAINRQRRKKGQPEEPLAKLLPLIEPTPLPEAKQWLRHFAGLSVALGTRRGELLAAHWEDVNMKMGTVALTKTKNGRPRTAFINALALHVLTSMGAGKHKRTELLFPDVSPSQVTIAFRRACKSAGVEDFSLHDLRHTFASHQRKAGTDIHELMTMMGHSDVRQTVRYSHLDASHLANAARRLDGVLVMPALGVGEKG